MTLPLLLSLVGLGGCSGRQPRCPEEMAQIGSGSSAYCIDRWEAHIVDPRGNPMAMYPKDSYASPTARSAPGVLPSVGITFQQAQKTCAATTATVDGHDIGKKHLTTEQEWVDGADGVVGPGGRKWPWGEDYDPSRCNSPTGGASGLAATGAATRCVSVEGVFDQVGNAFEWAETGLTVDTGKALQRFGDAGATLEIAPDDAIVLRDTTKLSLLNSFATAIEPGSLRTDAKGQLWMRWLRSLPAPKGFLVLEHADRHDSSAMLPVRFVPDAASGEAQLFLWKDGDGLPVPAKIGGSWYAGKSWPDAELNHTADFAGTIGFRCAIAPG